MQETFGCDYLVVGSGAMGLAFADELHTQRPAARIAIVDRRAKPGGHWNDAYRYVTLHQPAAFYGVNSRSLGPGGTALASGSEILAYYEKVQAKLEASGKVRFYPQCSYLGSGEFESLLSPGKTYRAEVARSIVDSTYMNVEVPSTTPPRYEVAPEARLIPPNGLPQLQEAPPQFVVIGAGKTGMDALLFLLWQGVDPERITWIVSHDAWLLDRATLFPGRTVGWFVAQLELIASSSSVEEVFLATEKAQSFMRVNESVWPERFRCATVNREELAELRRVKNVVREGRVSKVGPGRIELDGGTLETNESAVYVDCTACGLQPRERVPVWGKGKITLQSIFMCQQVFSASAIGYMESRFGDTNTKNALASPIPHPEVPADYLTAMAASHQNFELWAKDLAGWMRKSRLALPHHESFLKLLFHTIKARRVGAEALAAIERILPEAQPSISA